MAAPYDNRVFALLAEVATCLCAQIAADGLPDVCFCGVLPGEVTIADYASECDAACGMAYVRMTSMYPSVAVGTPSEQAGNCATGLGIEVEVGILRCAPMPDSDGSPPGADEQLAATQLQIADALAAWKAISCCQNNQDFLLGTYTPVGPQGDVVGGFWAVGMMVT